MKRMSKEKKKREDEGRRKMMTTDVNARADYCLEPATGIRP